MPGSARDISGEESLFSQQRKSQTRVAVVRGFAVYRVIDCGSAKRMGHINFSGGVLATKACR